MTSLFDAVRVGTLRLANRIVMAPTARVRSDDHGLATVSMAAYYAQRASAGLIVAEGFRPSQVGRADPRTPGPYTSEQVRSWRQVTSMVHVNGGRIIARVTHPGRSGHPAPTGHRARASFASAARSATEAGFDGVELDGVEPSGADSDLIAERIGSVVEAVSATVDAVGAGRVGLRLSPGAGLGDVVDHDVPELYGALLAELAPLGLAYVHVTVGADEEVLVDLRRAWPGTLIVDPSASGAPAPSSRDGAERWLARGADLISFGRAFLANPDLVERFRAGRPLAAAHPATFSEGVDRGGPKYATHDPARFESFDTATAR